MWTTTVLDELQHHTTDASPIITMLFMCSNKDGVQICVWISDDTAAMK